MLIQEFVPLLPTPEPTIDSVMKAMHIHPALNEVVQRACSSLMMPEDYHALITEQVKVDLKG